MEKKTIGMTGNRESSHDLLASNDFLPKLFCRRSSLMRRLCLVAIMFTLAGCGGVDFFPEFKRSPTTPDPFTFTPQTGVALSAEITSNAITVSGLTGDSSPISITGPAASNSKFAINDAAATATATTVKNGDKVTVTHTSASTPATATSSTLTIGGINGTLTSTTRSVSTPSFSTPTSVAGGFVQAQTSTPITSFDATAHAISVSDATNSGSASFSVSEANGTFVTFDTNRNVTALNGRNILVRNKPSAGVTTLTIDGVGTVVPLALP